MNDYLSKHLVLAAELGFPIEAATREEFVDLIVKTARTLAMQGETASGAWRYQSTQFSILMIGDSIHICSRPYAERQAANHLKKTVFTWNGSAVTVLQETGWLEEFLKRGAKAPF